MASEQFIEEVTATAQPSSLLASASASGHGVHDDGEALPLPFHRLVCRYDKRQLRSSPPMWPQRPVQKSRPTSKAKAKATDGKPNETVGAAQGGRSWRRSVVEWRPPPSLLLPLAGATHGKNHLAEGAESTLSAVAARTVNRRAVRRGRIRAAAIWTSDACSRSESEEW